MGDMNKDGDTMTETHENRTETHACDLISRQAALDALADYIHNVDRVYSTGKLTHEDCMDAAHSILDDLPSAQPEIAENLYLCKCLITDKDGLQHEVIHTGDIRRVTGWEI